MANPEKGAEAPKTNPLADAFEANADKKPPIDLTKKVPGYPNEASEAKDPNSDQYKKVVAELLPKMEEQLKKRDPDRKPQHGDAVGGQVDNKACFLVIDENATPRERIFIAKAQTEKAGQKTEYEPIPADTITQKSPGYKEISPLADKIKLAKEGFKKQRGREMEHKETSSVFDSKDYEYILLRDESRKGAQADRLFKSEKPVPA